VKTSAGFSKKLNAWYRKNARKLPWRETHDPYKVWISEIMLQQTTVNAVISYYHNWMKIFPSVGHVAKAPLQKILRAWQGLGYYTRAKNIHRSAKIICGQYGGKIPDEPACLKKLPGFGPYTVGAVLSIAFDKRYPIIDANVRRVFMRILAVEGYAEPTKDRKILDYLEKAMPRRNLRTFNQALMELGALVCRNREPLCSLCPVRAYCKSFDKGIQELIPQIRKKVLTDIEAAIGIIKKDGKYLIQKRPERGLLAGLWEFPGGKIKDGETSSQALKRELKEELDVDIKRSDHIMNVRHFYTQYRVNLHVSLCEPRTYPQAQYDRKWVTLKELSQYPMPSGSVKIVDRLSKD